jgi:CheY-like chemotaxis protein
VFRFEIPIEPGDRAVASRIAGRRRVSAIKAGQEAPKTLVVDDYPENRDWLMKLLASVGFPVRGAESGEAAIQTWEQWNPRLILMDVHLPAMDGLEATRRIKAHPRGKETIVVALTASAMEEDRRSAAQSGADDFLAKPCREDELLDKIRALVNVAYDYEETNDDEPVSRGETEPLGPDRLARLPLELLEEIRDATLTGNKRRLDALILKVPETGDTEIAHALQELADQYEYDSLARMLEEACRR